MAEQERLQSELLAECLAPRLRDGHVARGFIGRMTPIEWRFEPREFMTPTWFYVSHVPALLEGEPRQIYRRWREMPVRLLIDLVRADEGEEDAPWRGRRWIIEQQLWPAWYALVNVEEKSARVFRVEDNDYRPVEANPLGRFPILFLGVEFGFWEGTYQGKEGRWFRAWDCDTGALLPALEEREDWGDNPRIILESILTHRPTDRHLRLFAVACSRRYRRWTVWPEGPEEPEVDEEGEVAAKVAECFADGLAAAGDLADVGEFIVTDPDATYAASTFAHPDDEEPGCDPRLKIVLLRDVFADLVHKCALDPSWMTPTVVSLARAAYEERLGLPQHDLDPVRLSILADALEESGCTDQAVLDHLRSAGPHVRGCWALDLCLGKQ